MPLQNLLSPQLRIAAYRNNSNNVPFGLQGLNDIECLIGFIASCFQETTRVYDDNIGILRIGTYDSGRFCCNDLS
jgi:hypothetical protein